MSEQARSSYDEKRARILRTAAAVFAEKGYHQASIRDISRATGVSLSGLYYYFDSKEELLFQIQEHCFGTVLANLDRLLEGVDNPRARLRILIENHLRFFGNNMKEMKVLSHEAASLTGEYRVRINATKRRYTERCADILREIDGTDEVGLRTATFSLFGMLNWIYTWYHPDRDVPVERLAEEMSRLFLDGFTSAGPSLAGDRSLDAGTSPSIWRR